MDDLQIEAPYNLTDFLKACNIDYNKMTGEEFVFQRIILIDENFLWLTPFMVEQYSDKAGFINPTGLFAKAAIRILCQHGIVFQAFKRNLIPLPYPFEPPSNPLGKGIEGEIVNSIKDNRIIKKMVSEIENWFDDHVAIVGQEQKKGKKKDPDPPETMPDKPPLEILVDPKTLCQQMVGVWKRYFPKYAEDPEKDYPASTTLARKIAKYRGWPAETVTNGKFTDMLLDWEEIAQFAASDTDWFATRDMTQVAKEYQALMQKKNVKKDERRSHTARKISEEIPRGGFGPL
jgi:hypothetical protein